ncbi:MAG: 3-dehydroquinate synthase [Phycisphaerales bacterium]|nr:3-dehydroquinate synthase [Phycisphaerales bacterium]
MSDHPDHALPAAFDRQDCGVDAHFSTDWCFRLRFTFDALSPANSLLADAFDIDSALRRARVLAFVDQGLADVSPSVVDRIAAYAEAHSDRLELVGRPVLIPGGERAKNDRAIFDRAVAAIHDAGLCRRSYVLVIGGGAVLDVVGFAAAVAHRGVRLVRMPSTVLAQDDSGVGVKNGVNAFGKKNFLGTFAPPWAVINDFSLLATLSDRDWCAGFSECVKVALVKDAGFFEELSDAAPRLAARDGDAAAGVIRRSAELHMAHIATGGDPFELTAARPLDFGHWAAHKLEQMTDFEMRHGEAVSIGLALDSTYSMLQGWLSEADLRRIVSVLQTLGLPTFHPHLRRTDELLAGLEEFREHLGGRLTLAMLRGIGGAFDVHAMDRAVLAEAIERLAGEAGEAQRS